MMDNNQIIENLSSRARVLQGSKIRQVAEFGMKQGDVLPLWFGEGAWPTNPLIVDAAVASLKAGNHKYQPNNGAMNLRQEICRYSNALLNCQLATEQITVTPSGMQGLMLTAELLATPGDRVVAIEPSWPNIMGCFKALGAEIETLTLTPENGRWVLDVDALIAALTPETKAVVINSPNNPTGWTMAAGDQQRLLAHCRKYSIWIVADDVYSRLYRHAQHAPSFLSIAEPDDLLISVNSFSKCWSMTGWRLGWIVAPAACETKLAQLTEFNTSSTPGFVQDAGVVALRDGEEEIMNLQNKLQIAYDITAHELGKFSRVEFTQPDGAFYSFFRVDGLNDSLDAAMTIIQETKVGLAPGVAFGKDGEGYLRLCYAQPAQVLERAFKQLTPFLS